MGELYRLVLVCSCRGVYFLDGMRIIRIWEKSIFNNSNAFIEIVFLNNKLNNKNNPNVPEGNRYLAKDTLNIKPGQEITHYEFSGVNDEETLILAVDLYSDDTIRLFKNDIFVREWIGPPGNFGDSINSPFNYDSWVLESLDSDASDIVGKITFTITDEDLK